MARTSPEKSPLLTLLRWVGIWILFTLFLWVVLIGVTSGQKPPQEGKITLRLTVWDGDTALGVIRKTVEDFEAANPTIDVKLENFGDYTMYHQKMLTQYAANVAPDVAMMDMPNFQRLAKRGAILPLNDLFAQTEGFDITTYYKPIVDSHSWNGNVYVLPRDIAPMGIIYYNKTMFEELGIPEPDGSWTWDLKIRPELREKDFLWVAQQIAKKENGKKVRWGFASGWPQLWVSTMAHSRGLSVVDNPDDPTKILTNDPRFLEIYENLLVQQELGLTPSQTEVSSVLATNTIRMFVSKQVGMYQSGIWDVPNMRKELKPGQPGFFEWDITLAPAFAGEGGRRAAPTGGSGYAIFSSTKHKEAAWKLVQWMAGPPAMKAMAEAGIAQPAIRSLALTEGVWLPGPNTPLEQQYPRNRIATDTAVQYVVFDPRSDLWPEVGNLLNGRINSIFTGTTKPPEAIALGTKEAQARLDVLRKQSSLEPYPWGVGFGMALALLGGLIFAVYSKEVGKKYTRKQKQESRAAYWFIFPWLFGVVIFTVGPMIFSLLMSFADWDIIRPAQWRGFENYIEAFTTDTRVLLSLRVTIVFTLIGVPTGIIMALMLALLLNVKVKGIPLFRAIYYLPSLASGVAASLIWTRVFSPEEGILNRLFYAIPPLGNALSAWAGKPDQPVDWLNNEATVLPALVLMGLWGVGGSMVILLAGLQGVPQHYYEAATLDGAGPWHKFKNVTLPLITPALFFCLITGFIGSFQTFTQAFIMTGGGPNDASLFFMLHLYRQAFESLRMGYASALAWILFFLILAFTLLQLRANKWVYYEADAKS